MDWFEHTLESILAMAKTKNNNQFTEYDDAEPECSRSYGFRPHFKIWHTGLHIDMDDGKLPTD
ncbi:MAG: hypothetical protein PHO07_08155 [Pirellulales bacterium]|jgi:hypothetical protein|nr:hypothetical protein [Thermoguttaceae bacterium]MDD4787129.1 hypothetical protein [Pirellulales bacterium]MDI9446487.1 hypothetical protein [Planctomycetota bacterium]NLZ03034.1 hypothetical protein [Pirellulaceae bacterium]